MTLQEKLNDWHELNKISINCQRAMQTGNHLCLELFEQYLNARQNYETKYKDKYNVYIRPKK